jgi:hypothetical protein
MTAIMVGDVQALIDAFGQSLGLGFDAEPMLRAALATITNQSDWTEHGVRLDQMRSDQRSRIDWGTMRCCTNWIHSTE